MCETAVTTTPPSTLLKRRGAGETHHEEGEKHTGGDWAKHTGEKGENTFGKTHRRLGQQKR